MRHLLFPLLILVFTATAFAQDASQDASQDGPSDSPHARQSRLRPGSASTAVETERPLSPDHALPRAASSLTHVVHGYHPYWIPDEVADGYRWDLLSHLAYFSYEVDPTTGEATNIHGWRNSSVIDRAKAEGVKVLLTVTNFGGASNRTLLSSRAAQDTLIERLVALLAERGGHGVNLDFESVPGDMRAALVTFASDLRLRLDAARTAGSIPDAIISVAAPAVDWNGGWDVAALSASVDLFFVMCYDYSWSSSTNAGPVAPLRGMTYNVERSLRWYLDAGVPAGRLVMGVPYYGYDWPVIGAAAGSPTTGRGTARTYSIIRQELPTWNRQWSELFLNPWVSYESSSWRQLWYDDEESLEHKYNLVLDLGIAGTGMWALGYDRGYTDLWNLIERKFTRPASAGRLPERPVHAVWPQPLRPGAAAVLRLGHPADAAGTRLAAFDLLGRRVAEVRITGIHGGDIRFIAPDLAPGLYLFAGGPIRARVMIAP
ncbi:MAG: hypothetical protein KFF77_11590 [Bacteroidetes bacterium]|nr:hypothetical protein [Bacteroidota bacterium]